MNRFSMIASATVLSVAAVKTCVVTQFILPEGGATPLMIFVLMAVFSVATVAAAGLVYGQLCRATESRARRNASGSAAMGATAQRNKAQETARSVRRVPPLVGRTRFTLDEENGQPWVAASR